MSTGNSPTGIEPDAIACALTAFVNANIMARGRPVQPDDDFELMGVDSMALLKVLLFVEAEFGFWMPDEDLVAEQPHVAAGARALHLPAKGPLVASPRTARVGCPCGAPISSCWRCIRPGTSRRATTPSSSSTATARSIPSG